MRTEKEMIAEMMQRIDRLIPTSVEFSDYETEWWESEHHICFHPKTRPQHGQNYHYHIRKTRVPDANGRYQWAVLVVNANYANSRIQHFTDVKALTAAQQRKVDLIMAEVVSFMLVLRLEKGGG